MMMSDYYVELVTVAQTELVSEEILLVSAPSATEAFEQAERLRPGAQAIDAWLAGVVRADTE